MSQEDIPYLDELKKLDSQSTVLHVIAQDIRQKIGYLLAYLQLTNAEAEKLQEIVTDIDLEGMNININHAIEFANELLEISQDATQYANYVWSKSNDPDFDDL